eukprot:GHVU01023493.1.p1 GENE.GHVU01023493.1~~GHVU01023493.1.p1  ORF type:complete len:196 (+),score=12.03 GHVU01023493.1:75-662(+)
MRREETICTNSCPKRSSHSTYKTAFFLQNRLERRHSSHLLMGTGANRSNVYVKAIFDKLGAIKSTALINWHALTGCDTTGHIQGKGKTGCFSAFMTGSEEVLDAISNLGLGEQPSAKVLLGCEQFLTSLFRPTKLTTSSAKELRWHLFKGLKEDQGVNRLPPTPGVWAEHIKRAHLQANIWSQEVILNPEYPDPQ